MAAIRDDPCGELAQTVVQPVDGLHRGRRIEERRFGQRSFSHVNEHPEAIGDVLAQGALEARDQRDGGGVAVEGMGLAFDANEWGAGRYEATDSRYDVQDAVTGDGELHQPVPVDGGHDSRVRRPAWSFDENSGQWWLHLNPIRRRPIT